MKTIKKIALVSGVLSIVFMSIAIVANYQINKMLYQGAPDNFIVYNLVAAMLPFLFVAILSFVIAFSNALKTKPADNKENETKNNQEVNLEKAVTTEMETA